MLYVRSYLPALAGLSWAAAWLAGSVAMAQEGSTEAEASQPPLGVGVELVLAVDVSLSMDQHEQTIQRRGYAEAFRSADVQRAIYHGGWSRIAVTYLEWGGAGSQTVVIPWTLIDSDAAAEEFAAVIEASPMSRVSRTSISAAIDYAADLFEDNGFAGFRRVIDISGDGPNNAGRSVVEARDEAVARGIVINGLPLMTETDYNEWTIPDLDTYYAGCVIGGPGAFSIAVTDWTQFAAAVRQKLVLEIAGPAPRGRFAPAAAPDGGVILPTQAQDSDCLVGERMWNNRWRNRMGD